MQVADERGDTQIIDILSRHADRATLSIMRSSAVAPEGSFGYQKWQVRFVSVCLSVCLSISLSIYLSVYISLYLSLSVWLSVCLSACLPVYLSIESRGTDQR